MGKSLEFVKQRIASGECGNMKDNSYSSMNEVSFLKMINRLGCRRGTAVKGNSWEYDLIGIYEDGEKKERGIIIEYNPDAEFEYFTIQSCICDGTVYFYLELCERILEKIFLGITYCKPKLPENYENEIEKYVMKYTVGDFVFTREHGNEFSEEETPWMKSRFSVMLPIKCDFIKKDFQRDRKM